MKINLIIKILGVILLIGLPQFISLYLLGPLGAGPVMVIQIMALLYMGLYGDSE